MTVTSQMPDQVPSPSHVDRGGQRKLLRAVARYIGAVLLAVWLGGLTFYSWVVIPAGAAVVGGSTQGFITQRVTDSLNWIAAIALASLLPSMERRWMWYSWGIMAIALAAAFMIHPRIDAAINAANMEILDEAGFRAWHKEYLIAITIQGLAGLAHMWGIMQTPRESVCGRA